VNGRTFENLAILKIIGVNYWTQSLIVKKCKNHGTSGDDWKIQCRALTVIDP
jgi:hypothetical protein